MPSLLYAHPQLGEFSEKTIRWPGYWEGIDMLKETGMLDLEDVEFAGGQIKPRDFFVSVVKPRLKPFPEDKDLCLMWN